MKQLIAFLLLTSSIFSYSQDYFERTDLSPYGQKYSHLDANMSALSSHKYLTQFTYFELNFVNTRLEQYLTLYSDYSMSDDIIFVMDKPEKYLINTYEKKVSSSSNKRTFQVKYNLFEEEGNLLIKSVEISGYWEYIIDIYINYWTTNLNFEATKKEETVINYLLQDRVALTLNAKTKTGKIVITNTSINNLTDYYKQLTNEINKRKNKSSQ